MMKRPRKLLWFLLLVLIAIAGCNSVSPVAGESFLSRIPAGKEGSPTSAVRQASYHEEENASQAPTASKGKDSPFSGVKELSLETLVQEVLSRNPNLAQMQAAWQAARARYPQVTSLEDPMFGVTIGPETFAPDDKSVEFAYRFEISQKYPWPGKRQLRGQSAMMTAQAAANDFDSMRLQLIEAAKDAFYDHYLAERALEVNQQGLDLLDRIREDVKSRYESSKEKVSIQEVYQFNVEIGREQQRRLTLERMREVAKARINTLIHCTPDQPLPAPAKELMVKEESRPIEELRQQGLARRPDLQAARNRLAADEAALEFAHKEFYPDFEPFFMYDRFMGNTSGSRDLASMVGVRLNLPVRRERRNAAVEEAEAKVAQGQAELAKITDQINFEIEQAYQEIREAAATVHLYETRILKDAEANVDAARPAYKTGLISASSLLEAERTFVDMKDRHFQAVADYHRRLATLERAVGGSQN
jgi:outer membrane protein TolC